MATSKAPGSVQVVLGIVVLLMGLVFLADSAGMLQAGSGVALWPVGVVALGVFLAQKLDRVNRLLGAVLLVAGLWLLLNALGVWSYSFWHTWPYLLIAIGTWILYRVHFLRDREGPSGRAPGDPGNFDQPITDAADIGAFAFLNSVERTAVSGEFDGGELNTLFGGCDADLTRAIPGGPESFIDTFTVFGRVDVEVPAGWNVESRIVPLLSRVDNASDGVEDPTHTLVLRGTSILGKVSVSTVPA